jgi:hypothetical protein
VGTVLKIRCTHGWVGGTITFLSPVMFVLPKQLHESLSTIAVPIVNHCDLCTPITVVVFYILLLIRVKNKVNSTLEQAMKAQRGSRDIVLLFL